MVSIPTVDVRRSGDRAVSVARGLRTLHSFSGGGHYDAANTSFGPLVLHDEHLLGPGAGFAVHRHRRVEVVTWVLDGALRHADGAGDATVLRRGDVQRLTTGTGVEHAELNDRRDAPLRFVQSWLLSDDAAPPGYDVQDVGALLDGGVLVTVASGAEDAPLRLSVDADLHAARPPAGGSFLLPQASRVHLYLAAGSARLEGVGDLEPGDAVRLTGEQGRRLSVTAPAEVLVWALR